MAANYENDFRTRSEYGRGRGGDYLNPAGKPRGLSVGERARLMRRDGVADQATPTNPDAPQEFGERIA